MARHVVCNGLIVARQFNKAFLALEQVADPRRQGRTVAGGALDRIDSLVWAVAIVYYLVVFLGPLVS